MFLLGIVAQCTTISVTMPEFFFIPDIHWYCISPVAYACVAKPFIFKITVESLTLSEVCFP